MDPFETKAKPETKGSEQREKERLERIAIHALLEKNGGQLLLDRINRRAGVLKSRLFGGEHDGKEYTVGKLVGALADLEWVANLLLAKPRGLEGPGDRQ